jgi:hypothetical protein
MGRAEAFIKASSSCFSMALKAGGSYSLTTILSYPLKDQRSSSKQDYSSGALSTATDNMT